MYIEFNNVAFNEQMMAFRNQGNKQIITRKNMKISFRSLRLESFISLFRLLFTLDPIDVIDEFIELRGDELDVEE